jgi:hypothetical protein
MAAPRNSIQAVAQVMDLLELAQNANNDTAKTMTTENSNATNTARVDPFTPEQRARMDAETKAYQRKVEPFQTDAEMVYLGRAINRYFEVADTLLDYHLQNGPFSDSDGDGLTDAERWRECCDRAIQITPVILEEMHRLESRNRR